VEVVASLSQGRTAATQCGLFTHKSVPVIFEPPCIKSIASSSNYRALNAMNNKERWIWKCVKGNGRRLLEATGDYWWLLETLYLYFGAETEEFYGNSPGSVW